MYKKTASADNLLSLLLSEKIVDQDEVVAFQSIPDENKFDFLLKILQDKKKDNSKFVSSVLGRYFTQYDDVNASRSTILNAKDSK